MKRTVAFLLSLLILFTLVACSAGNLSVPDGYKLASDDTLCDYRLFVPETWVSESTESNYTMASVSQTDNSSLSVAKLENVYAKTVAEYWENQCKGSYSYLTNFATIEEGASVTVGSGENVRSAHRYTFTGEYGGVSYKFMQIFLVDSGVFSASLYCVTYTARAESFDTHMEAVNSALAFFQFK